MKTKTRKERDNWGYQDQLPTGDPIGDIDERECPLFDGKFALKKVINSICCQDSNNKKKNQLLISVYYTCKVCGKEIDND